MVKAKGNYDEVRERLKFVIEENSKNNENNKAYEDKIHKIYPLEKFLKDVKHLFKPNDKYLMA